MEAVCTQEINWTEKINNLKRLSENPYTESTSEKLLSAADINFRNERNSMGIDCKACNNTGIIISSENGYLFTKECACMTEYKNHLRIKKSGLIKSFELYSFENYKATNDWQKRIKDKAMQFLLQSGKWFYIGGAVGSGKSHICTAICGELIKQKHIYFMPWRDEIVKIKANVTSDEEYEKLIHKPKHTEVLYIDDFLKGKITDGDKNVAFELLNYRYVNRLTTIISSEYRIDDIISVDEAIGSRIRQMAGEFSLNVPKVEGRNYRLNQLNAEG